MTINTRCPGGFSGSHYFLIGILPPPTSTVQKLVYANCTACTLPDTKPCQPITLFLGDLYSHRFFSNLCNVLVSFEYWQQYINGNFFIYDLYFLQFNEVNNKQSTDYRIAMRMHRFHIIGYVLGLGSC